MLVVDAVPSILHTYACGSVGTGRLSPPPPYPLRTEILKSEAPKQKPESIGQGRQRPALPAETIAPTSLVSPKP